MLFDTPSLSCQCSPVDPLISFVSSFLIDSSTRQIVCRSQPPGSLLHQRGARGPGRSPGSAIKSSVANLQRSSLRADDTYAPQKWVQCAKCEQWRKVCASPALPSCHTSTKITQLAAALCHLPETSLLLVCWVQQSAILTVDCRDWLIILLYQAAGVHCCTPPLALLRFCPGRTCRLLAPSKCTL